jgi:hypothetical protein
VQLRFSMLHQALSIFRPTKQTLPARVSTGDAIFPFRARRRSLEPSPLDAIPLSTLITTRNYAILEAGGALKFLMRENAARSILHLWRAWNANETKGVECVGRSRAHSEAIYALHSCLDDFV